MTRTRAWTAAIFAFVFADAVAVQVRGPILATLEETFSVSEAALGLVAPAGTAGFLVAVVVTGTLAGRLSVHRTLLVGTLCTAVGLLAMSVSPIYVVFLAALLIQGTAAGAFRGVDRVVLSHLHTENRGRVYAAYTLVWAVGAVLAPQLVTLVLAVSEWRVVFLVVAALYVPIVLFIVRNDLPAMDAERSISVAELRALLARPAVVGACAGMALTGALEGVFYTWLVYYAETLYPTTTANALFSLYLLAYIPARLGYTVAVGRVPYLALLFGVMLPAAPALALVFSGVTGPVLFAAVFVSGAAISSGFPTLSAYVVEAAPEYSGPLNAVTNGSTYLGLATAPAVVGVLAEGYGLRPALLSTVVVAVVFVLVIAALWWWTGTADAPRSGPGAASTAGETSDR